MSSIKHDDTKQLNEHSEHKTETEQPKKKCPKNKAFAIFGVVLVVGCFSLNYFYTKLITKGIDSIINEVGEGKSVKINDFKTEVGFFKHDIHIKELSVSLLNNKQISSIKVDDLYLGKTELNGFLNFGRPEFFKDVEANGVKVEYTANSEIKSLNVDRAKLSELQLGKKQTDFVTGNNLRVSDVQIKFSESNALSTVSYRDLMVESVSFNVKAGLPEVATNGVISSINEEFSAGAAYKSASIGKVQFAKLNVGSIISKGTIDGLEGLSISNFQVNGKDNTLLGALTVGKIDVKKYSVSEKYGIVDGLDVKSVKADFTSKSKITNFTLAQYSLGQLKFPEAKGFAEGVADIKSIVFSSLVGSSSSPIIAKNGVIKQLNAQLDYKNMNTISIKSAEFSGIDFATISNKSNETFKGFFQTSDLKIGLKNGQVIDGSLDSVYTYDASKAVLALTNFKADLGGLFNLNYAYTLTDYKVADGKVLNTFGVKSADFTYTDKGLLKGAIAESSIFRPDSTGELSKYVYNLVYSYVYSDGRYGDVPARAIADFVKGLSSFSVSLKYEKPVNVQEFTNELYGSGLFGTSSIKAVVTKYVDQATLTIKGN